MTPQLGRIGVWTHAGNLTPSFAAEIERLGYGAIWLGGSPDGDLTIVDEALAATDHLVLATGIVNIWKDDARTVATSHKRITAAYPDRFLLGIGVGHPEATSDYTRPYGALVDYLDVLDGEGVPEQERALAALGPKVLRLSAERSAGAHPYLVTPEHTREARDILGDGVLLAPEQKVVLETDPEKARAIGRPAVDNPYLGLTNYVSNLKRLGWSDADLARPGSDALIDALVGHGDARTAAARVQQHLDSGADHVPIQLLSAPGVSATEALPQFAALAEALLG
ncbi:LLM class F420-dependent oxidoreductase [uncultured Jatrophihabitans sp.]|uniref:LLM class F420-dependent oxidoreductase n=1 Tax=uncultured Jatrophihabitans sp. TaxID=1610747 RepID=UPI0035CC695A